MDFEKIEKNKETVMKVYQAFESGNYDVLGEYIAEDINEHTPDPLMQGSGLEYVKKLFMEYKRIFPDLKIKVNEMIGEGDKVVAYITMTGTHKGDI